MYDLMVLAYQANISRVITFMVSREVSNRTYTQVGVTDGHHAISHHQNRADKMEKNVRIQTFNVGMFAEFVEKLQKTPDGDGTLLDNTVLLYGSNMSNSNAHDHFPLAQPGGGRGQRPHEGRTPPAVRGPHADDEPARVACSIKPVFGRKSSETARGRSVTSRLVVGSWWLVVLAFGLSTLLGAPARRRPTGGWCGR